MKIAFLVDAFPSISETFILNQITGMIDLGHEVVVLSAARPIDKDFHSDIEKYELLKKTYYHNDYPRNWFIRAIYGLILLIRIGYKNPKAVLNSLNFLQYGREAVSLNYFYKVALMLAIGPFDILQCHYGPNGNLGALLKKMGIQSKIVVMFHGYDIRRGVEQGGQIYKDLFKSADSILSISEYNTKNLLELGARKEIIRNHPVGIDLTKFTFRKNGQNIEQPVKVVTVSRFVDEKGLKYGIEAVHKLIKSNAAAIEYHIVGDGPLREQLESKVSEYQISDQVRFYGDQIQQGVIEILKQSDIFFLPSIAEALPVVLMEAQAIGMPVVATAVGSISQIVSNGESGFLVDSKDVHAMAEKLEYLVLHRDEWTRMKAKGRSIVEEKFNIQKLNIQLEDHYKQLIS